MRRKIASRLRITGKLVASSPLHVGGVEGNADVDLSLARNGQGQLYVPGTSLAGSLRSWLLDRVDSSSSIKRDAQLRKVNRMWGFQDPEAATEEQGIASSVFVEDGLVTLPKGTAVEVREGVGIDRVTGTAAEHIKYNREVLPAGTGIELDLTVELKEKHSPVRADMLQTLRALTEGEIRLGGGKSRGLGKVMLEDLTVWEDDLMSMEGMLGTLRGVRNRVDLKTEIERDDEAPKIKIRIDWRPRGPVMVRAERDGVAVDMLPLVSARGESLTLVIPGSSIKGALRNHAERIVRTVTGITAPPIKQSKKDFMLQLEMADIKSASKGSSHENAGRLITGLFGVAAKTGGNDEKREIGPPLPGLSAISVDDCYAQLRFSPEQWETIEMATDNDASPNDASDVTLQTALEMAELADFQQSFYVAIDRWTGGAADGCLYSVLEPHEVMWEPLELSLNLGRIRQEDRTPAVMCLLLTLRDLVGGKIPLGFGVNRGLGAIEVTGIEITSQNPEVADLMNIRVVDGKLGGWTRELREMLDQSWTNWINSRDTEVPTK